MAVLSETEDVVMLNEEVFAPPNLRDADGRRAGDPSAFVENAANKLFHCVLYLGSFVCVCLRVRERVCVCVCLRIWHGR